MTFHSFGVFCRSALCRGAYDLLVAGGSGVVFTGEATRVFQRIDCALCGCFFSGTRSVIAVVF
ncbi:MAG: hypothetical protein J6B77_04555 [Clostridia bacterium]|nr:hypothetical protein [Clostridia bacterium]